MRAPVIALAFTVLVPTAARASNVVVSSSRSKTPATADWPANGTTSVGISGSWDLTETLSLDPSFSASKPTPERAADGTLTRFPATLTLGLSTSYTWTDLMFSLGGSFSPASTDETEASIPMSDAPNADELTYSLSQTTRPHYASFAASWAPSWEGNVVPGVSVGADYDHYGVTMKATKVTLPDGKSGGVKEVEAYCQQAIAGAKLPVKKQAIRESCEAAKKSLASTDAATLHVLMPNVSGTLTLWERTDVGLGLTRYLYSDDPGSVGEWNLYSGTAPKLGAKPQQQTKDTKPTAGGGGPKLEHTESGAITAASSYSANASVVHRLGAWKFSLALTRGQNRDDDGHYLTLGTKTYWKINKSWRVGVSVSATNDTDAQGTTSKSYLGGASLRYTF